MAARIKDLAALAPLRDKLNRAAREREAEAAAARRVVAARHRDNLVGECCFGCNFHVRLRANERANGSAQVCIVFGNEHAQTRG